MSGVDGNGNGHVSWEEWVHGLEVAHSLPGRLRLRWRALRGELPREEAEALADALVERRGVLDVTIKRSTGSVLVEFDPAFLVADDIVALVKRHTGARLIASTDPKPRPPRPDRNGSKLAVASAKFFEDLNDDVLRATDGHVDLAMLMPLGFVTLGLTEVAATGEMPVPPWWSLFWWSFRSFLSLNAPAIETAKKSDPEERAA